MAHSQAGACAQGSVRRKGTNTAACPLPPNRHPAAVRANGTEAAESEAGVFSGFTFAALGPAAAAATAAAGDGLTAQQVAGAAASASELLMSVRAAADTLAGAVAALRAVTAGGLLAVGGGACGISSCTCSSLHACDLGAWEHMQCAQWYPRFGMCSGLYTRPRALTAHRSAASEAPCPPFSLCPSQT